MSEPGGPNYRLRRLGAVGLVVVIVFVAWWLGSAVLGLGGTGSGGEPTGAAQPTDPSGSLPTTEAPPACSYGKAKPTATEYSDWAVTLLDTQFRLSKGYAPPGLVSAGRAGFGGDFTVRSLVVEDLRALRRAAEETGSPIAIVAAYRSFDQQVSLFERRVQDVGYEDAIRKTALPGHSEHQLGTAIDLKTLGEKDVDRRWESTSTGRWVAENAYLFGFVQSYPRGKTAETCYAYEPWHYRYFGREMAARIHDSGLSVRAFLWNVDKGFIQP